MDTAGNLYGTTLYGGLSNCLGGNGGCGVVFELSPDGFGGWTETILYTFTGHGGDGAYPVGSLTMDSSGNLYGATSSGGAHLNCSAGCGTVFRLSPDGQGGWTESVLHTFHQTDGQSPYAGVVLDGSGNIYGTTAYGGSGSSGVIYRISPDGSGGWTFKVLHNFVLKPEGAQLNGLVIDSSGVLYGSAFVGGTEGNCQFFGCGTVFQFTPTQAGGGRLSIIYSFVGSSDGGNPNGLTMDAAGNLYGTAFAGGNLSCGLGGYGCGTVFKLTRSGNGWTKQRIYAFADNGDGVGPLARPTADTVGNIYGTADGGGANGKGTVFELVLSGGSYTEQTLHSFGRGQDGYQPHSGVTVDGAGNVFGATSRGGDLQTCMEPFECGVVYEIVQ